MNRKSDATPPRRLCSIHRTTVASCPVPRIADRYRIVSLVGRGGMGEVYRADDLKLGHAVALKFLPKDLANDPRRLQLFHDEVRLARQISHPNVCRVHDIGEVDGQHFLSMEYHRRRGPERALAPDRPASQGQGDRDRPAALRGAGRRAREGRPAPGPEAGQHHARRAGPGPDHRLWPRPVGLRRESGRRRSRERRPTWRPSSSPAAPRASRATCIRWGWFSTRCSRVEGSTNPVRSPS